MSLPHILLGMLDEPASGYDIKHHFNGSLVHFWGAELAQIYPALKKLQDEGLLISKQVPSEKGPARKIYRRTQKGTKVLHEWLSSEPETGATRIPYLAQIYFVNGLDNMDTAMDLLTRLRGVFKQRARFLEQANQEWKKEYPGFPDSLSDQDFFRHMTLESGIAVWNARLKWCENCIKRLSHRLEKRELLNENTG